MVNEAVLALIRSELRAAADPIRGAAAQAYMKSATPSLGVRVPEVRSVAGDRRMLPVYEETIRTGSSWDYVDGVAHRIGALLKAHREELTRVLLQWSVDRDFWIRRASITAQLGARFHTDTGLLTAVIEANTADREFFIRKAIGWALREYAKTDPEWVLEYVTRNSPTLSPLSRREALKNLQVR
jgi:3-methyladenine DNA glycosylase AlkD